MLGVVGLAFTCIQTLFFLNCLNSRRRERRRLEQVFRDSLRTVKGDGVKETYRSHVRNEAEVSPTTRKENRSTEEQVTGRNINNTCDGRLVTRLVVKSGKEAAPGSHEGVSSDPHCLRVQSVVVHLGGHSVEDERGCAAAGVDMTQQQPVSASLGHNGSTSTSPPPNAADSTITVNSNMIHVSGDAQPPLLPSYESLEGDPLSILTQVTTLGEEGGEGRQSLPDYTCIVEEDLDSPLQDLSLDGARGDVDLLGTISQILQSPPESMEPGSESIHLYETPTEVNVSGASQHAAPLSGGEDNFDCRMTAGRADLHSIPSPPWGSAAQHDFTLSRRPTGPPLPPRSHDTWTLPRACRRATQGHGSLPRPREKLFIVHASGKLSSIHTPTRPASVHTSGRDEALRAGGAARGTFTFQSDSVPPTGATSPPPPIPRTAITDLIASQRGTVSDAKNNDSEVSAPPLAHRTHEWDDGEPVTEHSEEPLGYPTKPPSGHEHNLNAAVYDPAEDDLPSLAMATPLRQSMGGDEAGHTEDDIYEDIKDTLPLHAEDRDSVGSETQYENISESDTHADSGYESPGW